MDNKKAIAAALLTYTIFGLTFLFTRIALNHADASILLSLRFIISFSTMAILAIAGSVLLNQTGNQLFRNITVQLKGKPVFKLLMLGLAQPIVYFTFETLGIKYTNSSFAGIIISLIPIAATILAAVFLGEQFSPKQFGWILCSIAGVSLLSYLQGINGDIKVIGIFFMLGAVMAAATFATLSHHTAEFFTPFERSFVMMAMGCVTFTAYSLIKNGSDFISQSVAALSNPGFLLPTLYLSIISSVIAFISFNYAMGNLSVSKATTFTNVQPVISLIAGVAVLHEPISAIHILAVALILIGVYKVSKS